MDYRKTFVRLTLLAFVVGAGSAHALENENYIPGDVIVKYKEDAVRPRMLMNSMYDSIGVQHVRRFGGMMKGFERLRFGADVKVADIISELEKNPLVEYAEPNYVFSIQPTRFYDATHEEPQQDVVVGRIPCIFPGIPFPPGCEDGGGGGGGKTKPPVANAPAEVNPPQADPDLAKAWGIAKIGAPAVWSSNRGDKKMIVAVIDTGIDYNHEDLAYNVWRNPNPTRGDTVGYDFSTNSVLPFDDHMHGTHCAGTVGAVGGNGKAISGVSQYVSIMGLKFLTAKGSGTMEHAILSIDYAVANGAKVLSNSWGSTAPAAQVKSLREAIERAKAKDVLFIAAAGNDGVDNDTSSKKSFPAALDNDNLISVAASDQNDKLAFFSNYGLKTTHLAAPGTGIYSSVPGNSYRNADGTSMAAPHVAGAAALVWSQNPSMTYAQVKDILMKSVDVMPAFQGKTVSGGRLNVAKAVQMVKRR